MDKWGGEDGRKATVFPL